MASAGVAAAVEVMAEGGLLGVAKQVSSSSPRGLVRGREGLVGRAAAARAVAAAAVESIGGIGVGEIWNPWESLLSVFFGFFFCPLFGRSRRAPLAAAKWKWGSTTRRRGADGFRYFLEFS
jgi:hypothetical protein